MWNDCGKLLDLYRMGKAGMPVAQDLQMVVRIAAVAAARVITVVMTRKLILITGGGH